MKKLFQIAWRNLWRTPRRTVVTCGAMTLAVLTMMIYSSLIAGMLRDLERDIVDVEIGDVQVHAEGYLNRPSLYTLIDDSEEVASRIEAAGYSVAGNLLAGGLAASDTTSAGASLRGVDLEEIASVSQIADEVEEGDWLDSQDPAGVVVGKLLARTLDIGVGAELILLSQAYDGSMANDLFIVRGVLGTISAATDRAAVYMLSDTFRDLFGVYEGVHQLIVRRPEGVSLEAAESVVAQLAEGHVTKSWRALMPTLATMVDSVSGVIWIVYVIVYLVLALLILNAMLMAVFERIRELGVLKAIGLAPRHVFLLMAIEALLQAATAIVIGGLLAAPALVYLQQNGFNMGLVSGLTIAGLSMDSIWYGEISPRIFVLPVVTLVVLVFLGVLYPGIKAARVEPVEAMRHQ